MDTATETTTTHPPELETKLEMVRSLNVPEATKSRMIQTTIATFYNRAREVAEGSATPLVEPRAANPIISFEIDGTGLHAIPSITDRKS